MRIYEFDIVRAVQEHFRDLDESISQWDVNLLGILPKVYGL